MTDPYRGEVLAVIQRYDLFDDQTLTEVEVEERIYIELSDHGVDATPHPFHAWWQALARKPEGPHHLTYLKEQERLKQLLLTPSKSTVKIEEVPTVDEKVHIAAEAKRISEAARRRSPVPVTPPTPLRRPAPVSPPPPPSPPPTKMHTWRHTPLDIVHALRHWRLHQQSSPKKSQ